MENWFRNWNAVSESVAFLHTLYTYIWLYIFLTDMYLFIKNTYYSLSKVGEIFTK